MSAEAGGAIVVTMGEAAGIGPEIAGAAWQALNGRIGVRQVKIIGDPALFPDIPPDALIATRGRVTRVPGKPASANAAATIEAIETGVAAASRGAGLVTAPINKAVLAEAGFAWPGHTEFLAHLTGARRAVMMLASETLRVVPLTVHMPLAKVSGAIRSEDIVETAEIVLAALARDFGIAKPRLAVAGLNPHAGEDGVLGGEDAAIIAPAIAALKARGHDVRGPLSADTMFHVEARSRYDAALCMYHDQALIPIKTLAFWEGVNVTLGLPIVRTSPDHGTAFDIAGTGKADPRSMIAAIRMAAAMMDARSQ
ncbi:MAG TPA: 4-hydroxythreonine-4-phosphate dehydrogenase PdxA [Rhizomicrobium sp.]